MNYLISHIVTHTSLLIHPKLSVSSVVNTLCRSDIRSLANNFCSCSGITRTLKFIKHMFIFIIGITSRSLLIVKIIIFVCQMGKLVINILPLLVYFDMQHCAISVRKLPRQLYRTINCHQID